MTACEFHCDFPVGCEPEPGRAFAHDRCLLYWLDLGSVYVLEVAGVLERCGRAWSAPDWLPGMLMSWDRAFPQCPSIVIAALWASQHPESRDSMIKDPMGAAEEIPALRADESV